MKKFVLLAATAAFASTGAAVADGHSATLADTVARGTLKCGVNLGVPGFAEQAADGSWSGLDVDVCKAVAAAIFGTNTATLLDDADPRTSASGATLRCPGLELGTPEYM